MSEIAKIDISDSAITQFVMALGEGNLKGTEFWFALKGMIEESARQERERCCEVIRSHWYPTEGGYPDCEELITAIKAGE